MKRAPLFVLAGTVAGLAGILSFHTHPQTSGLSALPAAGNSAAGKSATGNSAAGNSAAGTATGSSSGSHSGSAHSRARTSRRSSTSGSRSASTAALQSATGSTVQYGYGELAVKVTVRGGRIVNVTVPTIQTAEPYSQQLASQAIPTLRSEVLAAQSANIQAVSGATYTSQAYEQSLQSALDKLHLA
jgi:uncharacterized protein with FMN-binding domain